MILGDGRKKDDDKEDRVDKTTVSGGCKGLYVFTNLVWSGGSVI